MPVPRNRLVHRLICREPDEPCAPLRNFQDLRVESLGYAHRAARTQLATRAHHCLPHILSSYGMQQQDFRGCTRCAAAEQTRAQHPGGVQHYRVARHEQTGKIPELRVLYITGLSVYHH